MEDVKNRIYNFETTPPAGVWEAIVSELDGKEAKVIPLKTKSSKRFYYMAAASVAIILFSVIFFTQRSGNNSSNKQWFSWGTSDNDSINNQLAETTTDSLVTAKNDSSLVITVPDNLKYDEADNTDDELLAKNTPAKGGPSERIRKAELKKIDISENKIIASRYITIEGPQGQPLQVSSKLATLIDSSDNNIPPKPSWNKKINEWREIMKGNTLAPTPGNFLDIIELSKTLKDNKIP
jgi:hypothetical protein